MDLPVEYPEAPAHPLFERRLAKRPYILFPIPGGFASAGYPGHERGEARTLNALRSDAPCEIKRMRCTGRERATETGRTVLPSGAPVSARRLRSILERAPSKAFLLCLA